MAVDFVTNQILAAARGDQIVAVNGSTGVLTRYTVGTLEQNVAVNSFYRSRLCNEPGTFYDAGRSRSGHQGRWEVSLFKPSPFAVCVDYLSNLIFRNCRKPNPSQCSEWENEYSDGNCSAVPGNYIDVNPATRLVYASDGAGAQVVHVISE